MRKTVSALLICIFFGGLMGSCNTKGFYERRGDALARLAQREWTPKLDSVEMGDSVRECVEFLYAYMPYGDVGEYDLDLFKRNAEMSMQAFEELPWSDSIPRDLFMHFVLPVRVNNEALDTSRVDFYADLKDRVKSLSMKDAILEVNHWCHEKAVYTPSDGRTSSPSATVRSAFGRCGEESTFAVAALRAVGIPARQIYVPRWAHTDDNHAWVEAWADGKWWYIGACEPEPVLNKGWFDSPAKRSLLMFTKVFGDYQGAEEVISRSDCYTEINVTDNYAPVRAVALTVTDAEGKVVEGAEVLFNIYNYAELYPAVRKTTDSEGKISFTAGLGDIAFWASKGGKYGFAKVDLRTDSVATIILDKDSTMVMTADMELNPPVELPVESSVTEAQKQENGRRFAIEDSIRGAYTATFYNQQRAEAVAAELGTDVAKTVTYLISARGNHAEIVAFLRNTSAADRGVAMDLLGVISEKDLRDTPESVLRDHLTAALPHKDKPYFVEYILNPRVDTELLTPYRTIFAALAPNAELPITGIDSLNPANVPVTPLAVHRMGMADRAAYERYMITLNRSRGIAARREPLTERPQFLDGDKWQYIELPEAMQTVKVEQPKGELVVVLGTDANGKSYTDDPKYYSHFTLARLENGVFRTIDMSSTVGADMGAGLSYKTLFNKPLTLETGTYKLITGTRMANGAVLVRDEIFRIQEGKVTTVEMSMRQSNAGLQVIGNIDPEVVYTPASGTKGSVLNTTGRGYFVLALMDAKKEPTTHMLRGLEANRELLEKWGRPVVLVLPSKGELGRYNKAEFGNLPRTVSYGSDGGEVAAMLKSMLKLPSGVQLPILVIADSFGRVVYLSTGYNTSLGEQIKNTVSELNQE